LSAFDPPMSETDLEVERFALETAIQRVETESRSSDTRHDLSFISRRASLKPSSFSETERALRGHSAPLHRLRLDQIDRRKVAALLGEIETSAGPVARNRARSALSSFFSWCVSEGLLEVNPVQGTAKATENGSRERVLSTDELRGCGAGLVMACLLTSFVFCC
jgi:site-specific recombinase XerD